MTKKFSLHRSGFTLLELLVAASIFVGVAILTAGALIATVRIQNSQKVSKNVNVQTERALQEISFKIERSYHISELSQEPFAATRIISVKNPGSGANPKDEILVALIPRIDADGAIFERMDLSRGIVHQYERHVFCAEPQYQIPGVLTSPFLGKRLVDFRLPLLNFYETSPVVGAIGAVGVIGRVFAAGAFIGDLPIGAPGDDGIRIAMGPISVDMQCTKSKLAQLFTGVTEGDISSSYLTDLTLNVINFRAWPVWFGILITGQVYDINPPGIRVEMTTQYNPSNTSVTSDVEKRVGQDNQVSPQVVSKILINRTTKHSYFP